MYNVRDNIQASLGHFRMEGNAVDCDFCRTDADGSAS